MLLMVFFLHNKKTQATYFQQLGFLGWRVKIIKNREQPLSHNIDANFAYTYVKYACIAMKKNR